MALSNTGEVRLKEKIDEILEIESHLFSSRTADLYRGFDRHDGASLSFWLSRDILPPEAREKFLIRLNLIENIALANCPLQAYGIDGEGRAFAVFPPVDSTPITFNTSGPLDAREAERRFTPCLQTIEKIHNAGIVLGDICPSSFIIDRSGKIVFIGVMGDVLGGQSSAEKHETSLSINSDERIFSAPEQKLGRIATQASDVYAIGVLGFYLFGGRSPFASPNKQPGRTQPATSPSLEPEVFPLPQKVSAQGGNIPVWCNEVFSKALHPTVEIRYRNAAELHSEVQALRQKALFASEAPLQVNRQLGPSKYQRADGASTFKPLGDRAQEESKEKIKSVNFKPLILGFLGLVLTLVIYSLVPKQTDVIKQQVEEVEAKSPNLELLKPAVSDSKLLTAIEVVSKRKAPLESKQEQLKTLVRSEDPLAHEILIAAAVDSLDQDFRILVQRAISDRVKRLGGVRSSEQLRRWLGGLSDESLPEIYETMLKAANLQQSIQSRESLLRQAYPKDPRSVLNLAAAQALDSNNLQEYQQILSQLVGDMLEQTDLQSRSSLGLLIADPELSNVFEEDILKRKQELPGSDLSWALSTLAARDDRNIREFAQMALEGVHLTPIKKVFLEAIKVRPEISGEIVGALVRAGSGASVFDDVRIFGEWTDEYSERVLLALCADSNDPKIVLEAFETLAAKPLLLEPGVKLIPVVRNNFNEKRLELAPLIAAASLPGVLDEKAIAELVEKLEPFVEEPRIINRLVVSKDPFLSAAIVNKYGPRLTKSTLLNLLGNSDRSIRKRAILSLSDANDVGSLQTIIASYEKEKDPELIELFKKTFWVIAEREGQKK